MQHEKIFDMLVKNDDISWQSILLEAVKSEQMDPWDVDIKGLAGKFLEMLRKLKELDFKVSGKIVLAAAILLRLKSHKLVTDDLSQLDRLIAMSEETEDEFYDELLSDEDGSHYGSRVEMGDRKVKLFPRTPQPRKRKVSVYDLVEALEKALHVKNRRRVLRDEVFEHTRVPEDYRDIDTIILKVYNQIKDYFLEKKEVKTIKFSQLLQSDDKMEKIFTFYPLLHLSTQRHVDLEQEEPFADFDISLLESDNPLVVAEEEVKAEDIFATAKKKKKKAVSE